jgi:hypothetical protein
MKWEKPIGPVQMSSDGRYSIQHPIGITWIAYSIATVGTPAKLGEFDSDEKAKERCDDDERELTALRKSG